MQLGRATPATVAAATILAEVMRDRAYAELRTRQQLGYDVDVAPCRHGGAAGLTLSVSGGHGTAARAPPAIEEFLGTFSRRLASMPKAEFADLRDSAAMEMVC